MRFVTKFEHREGKSVRATIRLWTHVTDDYRQFFGVRPSLLEIVPPERPYVDPYAVGDYVLSIRRAGIIPSEANLFMVDTVDSCFPGLPEGFTLVRFAPVGAAWLERHEPLTMKDPTRDAFAVHFARPLAAVFLSAAAQSHADAGPKPPPARNDDVFMVPQLVRDVKSLQERVAELTDDGDPLSFSAIRKVQP